MTGAATTDEAEELRRENADLRERLALALKENEALRREVAELREKLNQNSGNSSRPPSSDGPAVPRSSPKAKTGRRPGGQPGHEAHQAELVPIEKVKDCQTVKPAKCRKCGAKLKGHDRNPLRHQVRELPEVEPEVYEWQLHELECDCCGERTRAELPPGVPRGGFGPRLIAGVALLTGAYRLTKRLAAHLLWTFFKMPISLGSVTACEQVASEAVAKPVEEAREYVKQQAVKHADESSWLEGPKRAKVWLWTVTTPLVTVFLIWAPRGKDVARKMLGKAFGVLVTDRWCAYAWWPLEWRQLCWSHIKRHWQAMVEAGGEAGKIGEKLQQQRERLFELWGRVRDGTLKRTTFRGYVTAIRSQIRVLLEQGRTCPHKKSAAMCSELLKVEQALYTFVRVEGVEPTNNAAERAIRPGVIWRNLCFGTHSRWGSRFVGRILTVVQTLKQQNRDALAFVTDCVHARFRGQKAGSLLPTAQ